MKLTTAPTSYFSPLFRGVRLSQDGRLFILLYRIVFFMRFGVVLSSVRRLFQRRATALYKLCQAGRRARFIYNLGPSFLSHPCPIVSETGQCQITHGIPTGTSAARTARVSKRWDFHVTSAAEGWGPFITMNPAIQNTPCPSLWMRSNLYQSGDSSVMVRRAKQQRILKIWLPLTIVVINRKATRSDISAWSPCRM